MFSTRHAPRVDYLRDIGVDVAEEPVRVWDELVDGVGVGGGGGEGGWWLGSRGGG